MGRGRGGGHGSHRSSGGGSRSRSFGGSSSHSGRGSSSHIHVSNRGSSSLPRYSSGPSHVHVTHYYHNGPGYGRCRCYINRTLSRAITWLVIMAVLFIMMPVLTGHSGGIEKSTVKREALAPYSAFLSDCIDDDAGWIHDRAALLAGMEAFYKETGVQPALAVYEEINGEKYLSDSQIEDFMYGEYDSLVGHERGLLLLFCEYADSDYYVYYMAGEDAQTVMDSEACDILIDYVHSLYEDDCSDEEFFAAVFEKTADRIMMVTPTAASKIPVIVMGMVTIAAITGAVIIIKRRQERDAERAKETERLLKTPIDKI